MPLASSRRGIFPVQPSLTSSAKGMASPAVAVSTRRAGCLETGLSGSTEARRSNPPSHQRGVISTFYPMGFFQHFLESGRRRNTPPVPPVGRSRRGRDGRSRCKSCPGGSGQSPRTADQFGCKARQARSTSAGVGSSRRGDTRDRTFDRVRRSAQTADDEKLNHERPARACQ